MKKFAKIGLAASLILATIGGCTSTDERAFGTARPAGLTASQSVVKDIEDLSEVLSVLRADSRHTLVVFDIDDTLLTSTTFYGSDYWYEWQKTLTEGAPGWVPCRFDVISLNYEVGTQKPTQDNAPEIFKSITQDKLLLTSRNAMSRGATLRELARAKYELPPMLSSDSNGMIYSWRKDAASDPKIVSYHDGIFMVTGQNKGLMLVDLLKRLGRSYERVVLVDDGQTNIDAMKAALDAEKIAYAGLHYIHIKKPLPIPAGQSDKIDQSIAGWSAIRTYLGAVAPLRLQDIEAKRCYY